MARAAEVKRTWKDLVNASPRGLFTIILAMFFLFAALPGRGTAAVMPQMAVGSDHTAALKSDGTVWTWGGNSSGQLGDGTIAGHTTPQQVPGLTGVVAISAGDSHTVVVKNDGTVWAWGDNTFGQLGNGTTIQSTTPQRVSSLTGVITIAAGGNVTLALKSDGTVWAWGRNDSGQLGDGTTEDKSSPVREAGSTTDKIAV